MREAGNSLASCRRDANKEGPSVTDADIRLVIGIIDSK